MSKPSNTKADNAASDAREIARPTVRFGVALSWSYLLTGGRVIVNLCVALVLAALLGPQAFGLVAIATVYVLFIEMVVRQGLVAAIVQRPRLTAVHLDTAFWMTMTAVLVLLPVTFVLSPWWANVNRLPELQLVIISLSPILVMKGVSVVPEALLRRQMEFRLLAIGTSLAVLLGGAVGITAAFAGAGYWALVAQQLTTAAAEVVLIWWVSGWKPRLRFTRDATRDLLGFSGNSALAGLGVFVYQRSDALLIGLFFGPVAVGLYRMAARFTEMVLELSGGAMMTASLSELSRYQHDKDVFRARAIAIIRLGAIIAVPILGVLAVSSDAAMRLIGPEWAPAAAPMKLLCVLGVALAFTTYTGPLLQAWGRPGVLAATTWAAGILSAASFTAAGLLFQNVETAEQVIGLAGVRLVTFMAMIVGIVLPVLRSVIGVRIRDVIRAVAPVILATAAGATLAWFIAKALPLDETDAWLHALATAGVAAGLIAALTVALEPRARRPLWIMIARARGRRL